jgi:RNA polymerase sigma-70 factor (ECF subfamily)
MASVTVEFTGALLDRSVQGDTSAFAGIVRANQSMVYSVAWSFLRDGGLAEELAQDVFLELYKNLRHIESGAHLVSWLRRVTVNRCIDRVRKRKREALTALDDAPELQAPASHEDPMASERLRRLIASLPEKQRAIVILRYQEDMDPTEIASVLEIPVNTVKSKLHRALALLRGKMERREEMES